MTKLPLSTIILSVFHGGTHQLTLVSGLVLGFDLPIGTGIIFALFTQSSLAVQAPPIWYWSWFVLRWHYWIIKYWAKLSRIQAKNHRSKLIPAVTSDELAQYINVTLPDVHNRDSLRYAAKLVTAQMAMNFLNRHPRVLSRRDARWYTDTIARNMVFLWRDKVKEDIFAEALRLSYQMPREKTTNPSEG